MRDFILEQFKLTKYANHKDLFKLVESYEVMINFYQAKTKRTIEDIKEEIVNLINNDKCTEELLISFGNEPSKEQQEETKKLGYDEYVDEMSHQAAELMNLFVEERDNEFMFYTTVAIFESDRKNVWLKFDITNNLEELYKKTRNKKKFKLVKYAGFYKSNRIENVKLVHNFFLMIYKLQSNYNIMNNKLLNVHFNDYSTYNVSKTPLNAK